MGDIARYDSCRDSALIKVVNRHTFDATLPGVYVYIGRGSALGNPFAIPKHGTRKEVIAKYRDYIDNELSLYAEHGGYNPIAQEIMAIREHSKKADVYLVCYCAPLPCHGDLIKDIVDSMQS